MSELMGWQKYLNLRAEQDWGVKDSGGTDLYVPYTEYSVAVQRQNTYADVFTGLRQRIHNRAQRATLMGTLAMPLWAHHIAGKSVAETLIEWARSGNTNPFLDSFTAECFEADTDNKRHLGLRVAELAISGEAGADIRLLLSLEGRTEVGGITPPSLSPTAPSPAEFLFEDARLFLSDEETASSASASDEELALRSFTLTMNNNLQTYHTNSFFPTVIAAGVREITFEFTVFKTDDTLDALRRAVDAASRTCRLELRGKHFGTGASGTYSQIEFHFDRLSLTNIEDAGDLNELVEQTAEWMPLKPETTSNDVDVVYSLVD